MTRLNSETFPELHKSLLPSGDWVGVVDGVPQLIPTFCQSNLQYLQWCYIKSGQDHFELFEHVVESHFALIQNAIRCLTQSKYLKESSPEIATLYRIRRYNSCLYKYGHEQPTSYDLISDPQMVWSTLREHCVKRDVEDSKRFRALYAFNPVVQMAKPQEEPQKEPVEDDMMWEGVEPNPNPWVDLPPPPPSPQSFRTPDPEEEEKNYSPPSEEDPKYPIRKWVDRSAFNVPDDPNLKKWVDVLPVQASECNIETDATKKRLQGIMEKMINV